MGSTILGFIIVAVIFIGSLLIFGDEEGPSGMPIGITIAFIILFFTIIMLSNHGY